uniref:Uncharacterized protein n=1 Tax=Nelumbo nucifera TaxID=4432 RepID=A0A822YNM6_NELNU|nr:TPA_asm: hypothetical protein HUJ06_004766 [Nelumbo nucifera]
MQIAGLEFDKVLVRNVLAPSSVCCCPSSVSTRPHPDTYRGIRNAACACKAMSTEPWV